MNAVLCYSEYALSEYVYSLKWSENMHISYNFQGMCIFPGFVKQLLHVITELKSVSVCKRQPLKYYTI